MIDLIALWFKKAVPTTSAKKLQVQLGVHFEEVAEHLEALQGVNSYSRMRLDAALAAVRQLGEDLKAGQVVVDIADRKEFLDACADQIVTATGCAYMANMNIVAAIAEVNSSNYSKFKDGEAVFDANGKIAKNAETFFRPNLEGMY